MIIGLMGIAGTGKTTTGRILRDEHGFIPISFADTLKDCAAALFGWPRHMLEGDTTESRTFRETPDPYWSGAFGKPLTPRFVLQYVGTELIRNWLGDFWIRSVGKKMMDQSKDYVVTDMRFTNEIEFIKKMGGFVVNIEGAKLPIWMTFNFNQPEKVVAQAMADFSVHKSEWEHVFWRANNPVDYQLYNNFTEIENPVSMSSLSGSVSHMLRVFTGPKDDKAVKNKVLDRVF